MSLSSGSWGPHNVRHCRILSPAVIFPCPFTNQSNNRRSGGRRGWLRCSVLGVPPCVAASHGLAGHARLQRCPLQQRLRPLAPLLATAAGSELRPKHSQPARPCSACVPLRGVLKHVLGQETVATAEASIVCGHDQAHAWDTNTQVYSHEPGSRSTAFIPRCTLQNSAASQRATSSLTIHPACMGTTI